MLQEFRENCPRQRASTSTNEHQQAAKGPMEFFRPRRIRRQSLVKSAVPAARRAQSPQTMAGSTQRTAQLAAQLCTARGAQTMDRSKGTKPWNHVEPWNLKLCDANWVGTAMAGDYNEKINFCPKHNHQPSCYLRKAKSSNEKKGNWKDIFNVFW